MDDATTLEVGPGQVPSGVKPKIVGVRSWQFVPVDPTESGCCVSLLARRFKAFARTLTYRSRCTADSPTTRLATLARYRHSQKFHGLGGAAVVIQHAAQALATLDLA
jgi:hypothetical protein